MGPPSYVAIIAADKRVVNSLVGLGFVCGHYRHVMVDAEWDSLR